MKGFTQKVRRPGIDMPGYIYFVTDGEYIKIGISGAPKFRLTALQGPNARPLTQIAVFPGSAELESSLHKLFSHLHVRGEWFQDTTGEIARYLQNGTGTVREVVVVQDEPVKQPLPGPCCAYTETL